MAERCPEPGCCYHAGHDGKHRISGVLRWKDRALAAEGENEAWRALADHSAGWGIDIRRPMNGHGWRMWLAGQSKEQIAEARTPQAAAIDLARRLGLLPKDPNT